MEQKYIIALEVSDSQVKGACASASPLSKFAVPTIEAIVSEDKINSVKYGRVQNLIETAQHLSNVLRKLENHSKLKDGHITSAYVALAGRSLGSISATAQLNLPSEMEITDDILTRLFNEATKSVPGDRKVLKVLPRKYFIDDQANPNPVGSLGSKLTGEFTIVTCNNLNRRNLEIVLSERLRMPVKEFVITPLAIADMAISDDEKQLGCALVDMGAQTTTVAIYKDKALRYLATLPLGSYNITHDLALGLNITDDRAETAKIEQGNALPESMASVSDENAKINSYVQARTGEIIANIIAQIDFAGFKPGDLKAGFIITGRGARLKNFDKALESQSKMPVRRLSIPSTLKVAESNIEPTDYASIIAIANYAAQQDSPESCIDLPGQLQEAATAVEVPATPYDAYNPTEHDNDDDILLDDEEIEKQRAKQRAKAEKQKAQKQKPTPPPVEDNPDDDEGLDIEDEPKETWFTRMKKKVTDMFKEEGEDADLDEN